MGGTLVDLRRCRRREEGEVRPESNTAESCREYAVWLPSKGGCCSLSVEDACACGASEPYTTREDDELLDRTEGILKTNQPTNPPPTQKAKEARGNRVEKKMANVTKNGKKIILFNETFL